MSWAGLLIALCLPWLLGVLMLRAVLGRNQRCNSWILLGQGYFVGMFTMTLVVRGWDAIGQPLQFTALALVLAALGMVALVVQVRATARYGGAIQRVPATPVVWNYWSVLAATLLLLLIAWRYVTLGQELVLRPLYAWDAWMNWMPRAIVWFDRASLVDFVHPSQWQAAAGNDLYVLGNRQAWNYPPSVSIIQLWSMLGANTSDHGALLLPWLMAPLALGTALFGHLRLAGVGPLAALTACYLLLNLPYLNVHSVLAGYADIWLAAAFAVGVFALFEWRSHRHWSYGLMVLVLAGFCSQLKVPGLILAAILVVALMRSWLNWRPRSELLLLAFALGLVALAMTLQLSLQLPYLGVLKFGWETMEVGRLGRFTLEYHPVTGVFIETFLHMSNWHLLGYCLPVLVLWYLVTYRSAALPPTEVLATMLAVLFVFVVFAFTGYYTQALNYVAINRALLYPLPAVVFVCFLAWPRRQATATGQTQPKSV